MMSRKGYVVLGIFAICLLLVTMTQGQGQRQGPPGAAPGAAAQQGGNQGYQNARFNPLLPGQQAPAAPAAGGGGAAPSGAVTNGPLSMILGPVGKVSNPTPWGLSKAPTTDTYYYDIPIEEWPPDEFISNPDREFDWHTLKGWHFVPTIKSVKILGNRVVQPGGSIQFECIVEDITGTQSGCGVGYYGPHGRRSSMSVRMTPTTPGGYIMRGTLQVPPNAEPGTWRATEVNSGNDTRHSKVYWADVHPVMQNLDVEVLPDGRGGATVDVIPPQVEWVRMNMLDQPETAIRTQKLSDAIPIYAKITDNKSGASGGRVKMMGPTAVCDLPTAGIPVSGPAAGINKNPCRYIEVDLQKVVGQADVWGALISVPQWWQPGEYKVYTMFARDKAGKEAQLVYTTSPSLKNARINLTNDPGNVDVTPPTLFSVWVDKTTARLGEPVTVSAILTDDKSGVGSVGISFAPIPSFIDRVSVVLKPIKAEGDGTQVRKAGLDINSNLWTGTVQTTDMFEPGDWRIDRIVARDNADNYMDIIPEYHPEIDVKINYTGGKNLHEMLMNAKKGIATNIAPGTAAPAGGGEMAAAAPRAAGSASITVNGVAVNGAYNAASNQITLTNGRVIDLIPGAQPDPATGKIRRIDMIPPHPPRGACLNCHEP